MNCAVFVFIASYLIIGSSPSPVDNRIAEPSFKFTLPSSIKISEINITGQIPIKRERVVFRLMTANQTDDMSDMKHVACAVEFSFKSGEVITINGVEDADNVPSRTMFTDDKNEYFAVAFSIKDKEIGLQFGHGMASECIPQHSIESITHLVVQGTVEKVTSLYFKFG